MITNNNKNNKTFFRCDKCLLIISRANTTEPPDCPNCKNKMKIIEKREVVTK